MVGIGASAGGLQAIKLFFENMPQDNGMAFVIILHLSPDHQSIADRIIQESTQMPVLQVTETVAIEKNHVYVISPVQRLSMNDGFLEVSACETRATRHASIDLFFRDLADVHRERAFCVVLSGTGSDGAVGLSRIKEQGGVTLAQAPEDAEFGGMPRAAIDTHMVDLVLPVVEMPQKLLELWRNSQEISLHSANDPELQTTKHWNAMSCRNWSAPPCQRNPRRKKFASGPPAAPPVKKPTAWPCCSVISCNWMPARDRCNCLPLTSMSAPSASAVPDCIRKPSSPTCRNAAHRRHPRHFSDHAGRGIYLAHAHRFRIKRVYRSVGLFADDAHFDWSLNKTHWLFFVQ